MNNENSIAAPYYFNTLMRGDYNEVLSKVESALKDEGFGILSTIDVQEKLMQKVEGAELGKYVILGACSPQHAYKAIKQENKIGTMLPCNVIIRETSNDEFEVSAVDPVASMQAIRNENLGEVAKNIRQKLQKVIESL